MQIKKLSLVCVLLLGIIFTCTAAGAVELSQVSIPVCFIQNNGQVDPQALFFADAPGYALYLTSEGQILSTADTGAIVSINYPGSGSAIVNGEDALEGKANFFIGDDKEAWVTNVPMYSSIRYAGLYDGITLVYHGGNGMLKREFIVDPGADTSAIRMQYSGHKDLSLDESGAILIETSAGLIFETDPVCYQIVNGERVEVVCEYEISDGDTVTFMIGEYDPTVPLVIDPVLDFSTYFGGTKDDKGAGIGMDDIGNVYIVGSTTSNNLPLSNTSPLYQPPILYGQVLNGSWDVFVAKLSPDGQTLLFRTYIGGNWTDIAAGISVNNLTDTVIITGYTESANYPDTVGTFKQNCSDVFITSLNPTGSLLLWSRYFSGNKTDQATGISLDPAGNPVIVGYTNSDTFPGITFNNSLSGNYDAFIANFDMNTGLYMDNPRYLGGTSADYGYGIAIDPAGDYWVTGSTTSDNFPVTLTGVLQPMKSGKTDIFITKVPSNLYAPLFSTYLGWSGDDVGRGIAVDILGNPYITGSTDSPESPGNLFPAKPPAFQTSYGGGKSDAFITKMYPDLSAINYSTYLGGSYDDIAYGIAVDDMGRAYVTGSTYSPDFPPKFPIQAALSGIVQDAFVTEINETGQALIFSTYLGGTFYDEAYDIAITPDGVNITITGYTESYNFYTMNPYQPNLSGFPNVRNPDAFIAKIIKVLPVANFTGEPLKGCSPLNVTFNDTSTGSPIQWFWDFGDNTNSTEQNPVHTYYNNLSSGVANFTVNLTVWNIDGSNITSKNNFTRVCPVISFNFTANQSERGCLGQNETIQFNVTSIKGGPMTGGWNWSFGDGTYNTTRNASHTYTDERTYNVSLRATNDCCNFTLTIDNFIDIRSLPDAEFTAVPTNGFVPLLVNFTDLSTGRPNEWLWLFGALQGNSTDQNTSHIYTVSNNYTVRLKASNFCGCNWSNKSNVIKAGDPILASFFPNKTSGFEPLRVGFNDTSSGNPTSWGWDFGDNTTSSVRNATHIYNEPGEYLVTLNASNIFGYDVSPATSILVKARANVSYVPQTIIIPTNVTTRVNLTLDYAEFGLSGYNITVFFDDNTSGNFTSAKFPAWASNLTTKGPMPGPEVVLSAVDLPPPLPYGKVIPGDTDIPLAYFNVTGLVAGPAFLRVDINEMTDDVNGKAINPRTIPAQVTVVNLLKFPGATKFPNDPDGDQKFYDIDGRNGLTFNDVVLFYRSVNNRWIDNQYAPFFNFDEKNGITFNDVVTLFKKVPR